MRAEHSDGFRSTAFRPAKIRDAALPHIRCRIRKSDTEANIAALCPTVRFLGMRGMSLRTLHKAEALADENGTSAASELIAYGAITLDAYYRALAEHLGLAFLERDDIRRTLSSGLSARAFVHTHRIQWCQLHDGRIVRAIAPDTNLLRHQIDRLTRIGKQETLMIAAPDTLRNVCLDAVDDILVKQATMDLATTQPEMSARFGASFWQGMTVALFAVFTLAALLLEPDLYSLVLSAIISMIFLGCVLVRLFATVAWQPPVRQKMAKPDNAALPVYSVMIAMHKEAAIVPDLIHAMKRLRWPRSKLQIMLVCEADDTETLAALDAEKLDPRFEIVRVPPGFPRTKPKALCHALPLSRGRLITLYDAEDRPHPDQLLEAFEKFEHADDKLACVQAPLTISNTNHNTLTAQFHMEYAGLFRGLLPWLASRNYPILLGGTSNHFRREALLDAGAWDPYNVTEDADLGLRLWRKGYRTDVLTLPTLEDAPTRLKVWIPQRTRWFKGWLQTWVVHTRRPRELWSMMGLPAFLATQVILTGTILSALLHPLLVIKAMILTFWIWNAPVANPTMTAMAWLTWMTVAVAYLAYHGLCWQATAKRDKKLIGKRGLLVPFYWLIQSFAAWRAVYQIFSDPFTWEKTPHEPHRRSR